MDLSDLKNIRQQLDVTQRDLADASGVSKLTILSIESRGRKPIPSTRKKIEIGLEKLAKEKAQRQANIAAVVRGMQYDADLA
ncbi:MAG: helix-turn-helix transcriptional regulator [Sphaerochaeta sp.]|jgi:predicted transcriptional regulator|nr:helix-turn-helix transcriptional regulator [Sphaerochaeta sp.]